MSTGARPLDWVNFFLADVRDGLGPFFAIYLLTERHWDEASIGIVMTIMGLATVAAQTPAGAFIDATRWKRGAIVGATCVIALASTAMARFPSFTVVAAVKAAMGAAAAILPAATVAVSLGIVGPKAFTRRVGRNETFNHAGNAAAAILAGLAGRLVAPVSVFYLVVAFGMAGILATLAIPRAAIDHDLARGLRQAEEHSKTPSGIRTLLDCRPLLVFAASVTLFHFANGAMLPMVGEKLARGNHEAGMVYMAACVIGAQLVMVPMAMLVGSKADAWGRKPLLLAGFAILPVRGLLYTLSNDPAWLLAVQLLDGVGAGLFGALFPLVVADLTSGTGRFNVSQGAIATAQGIGAAVSTSAAGFIQVEFGYDAAFLSLAAVALAAFALFALAMPETRPPRVRSAPLPGSETPSTAPRRHGLDHQLR